MSTANTLAVLRRTNGQPALLALASIDLTFSAQPAAERNALRTAVQALGIPHWCDPTILKSLLDDEADVSTLWASVRKLAIIEPFPARGPLAVNVHEASRLAIRKYLS